ncbi:MAG: hypothetical protein GX187_03930 [Clostridiaceae bacterium]|nr:hypothetical protein [Clostridiaceae bacterium]
MKREKIAEILKRIFGWGIFLTLIAGGLAFFGFLIALIIGGESATLISVFIHKKYFPIVIRIASATILLGLIAMYFGKLEALSLTADKKEADEELAAIKQAQESE